MKDVCMQMLFLLKKVEIRRKNIFQKREKSIITLINKKIL